jgi:hypothetical protein
LAAPQTGNAPSVALGPLATTRASAARMTERKSHLDAVAVSRLPLCC